jgi:hypothetical protein
MGAASERRALLMEANDDYNPYLTIDVNEYLIEEWPTLTAKHRQSVWHLCQTDEEFDYDPIHDQIDEKVYIYAESDPNVVIDTEDESEVEDPEEETEEDSDDESDETIFDMMFSYLEDSWPDLTEDQMESISNSLVDKQEELSDFLDAFVYDYAKANDQTIDLSEMEDEEDNE